MSPGEGLRAKEKERDFFGLQPLKMNPIAGQGQRW
jgi:hypothetical protein